MRDRTVPTGRLSIAYILVSDAFKAHEQDHFAMFCGQRRDRAFDIAQLPPGKCVRPGNHCLDFCALAALNEIVGASQISG
jgi:hypothetical protein